MKRKINNRVYNTDTAVFINRMVVQRRCTKVIVTVYKKRNGEYFLRRCEGRLHPVKLLCQILYRIKEPGNKHIEGYQG